MYVKQTDVPKQIIDWAKTIVGKGFENKIQLEKNKTKTIGLPWHDADKETHQFFKLINGAVPTGNPVSKSGWSEVNMYDDPYGTVDIPSGFVLATVGTYPKRLTLTVSSDAIDVIQDTSVLNELTNEEIVALHQAKALKSRYRQKFNQEVYNSLIEKELLKPNKAITIDGRNLISSEQAKDKLREIKRIDQEQNSWNCYNINV